MSEWRANKKKLVRSFAWKRNIRMRTRVPVMQTTVAENDRNQTVKLT